MSQFMCKVSILCMKSSYFNFFGNLKQFYIDLSNLYI